MVTSIIVALIVEYHEQDLVAEKSVSSSGKLVKLKEKLTGFRDLGNLHRHGSRRDFIKNLCAEKEALERFEDYQVLFSVLFHVEETKIWEG